MKVGDLVKLRKDLKKEKLYYFPFPVEKYFDIIGIIYGIVCINKFGDRRVYVYIGNKKVKTPMHIWDVIAV